jgi:uncharacterized protein YceH (UPF0502 family)
MYLERERLLSVSAGKVDVEELKAKVRGEVEQQSRQLQTLVNSLATENIDLKRRIQQVEEHIASIEKLFKELKQEVGSLAK